MKTLLVFLEDEVGRVEQDRSGRLAFTYDAGWRTRREAYALSPSMPLAASAYTHKIVDAFLWGLLPDNDIVIERWAQRFHTSRSAFALLAHVGEDCPGAVRFVTPERAKRVQRAGEIQWLSERDVAQRLRELHGDLSAWRRDADVGWFSLGGAQAKTALFRRGDRWGIPSLYTPTTHILKPPIPGLDGHVENEHFCLSLAAALGIPSARSSVEHFEDQTCIVVERFDRAWRRGLLERVHQVDFCQALGVHPTKKYENDGGPGAKAIVELLRTVSTDPLADATTFVRALALQWLVVGPDAHAKNYALLVGPGVVRLAPLYDVASVLLYPELTSKKTKLAMKIGGKYRVDEIGARAWEKTGKELRVDALEAVREMARALPDHAEDVLAACRKQRLRHAVLGRLAAAIQQRAKACAFELR